MPLDDKRLQELIRDRAARLKMSEEAVRTELRQKPLADDDLEERAAKLELPAEQVRQADRDLLRAAPSYPLSDCLKADEIANLIWRSDEVSAERKAHLAACSFCQAQLAVAQPDKSYAERVGARIAEMMRLRAASQELLAAPTPALGWRPRLTSSWIGAISGAAAVLLVWLGTASFSRLNRQHDKPTAVIPPPAAPPTLPADVFLDKMAAQIEVKWGQSRANGDVTSAVSSLQRSLTVLSESDMSPLLEPDREKVQADLRSTADNLREHVEGLRAGESPVKVRMKVDDKVTELVTDIKRPMSLPER